MIKQSRTGARNRGAFFYLLFDRRLMAALLLMAFQVQQPSQAGTPLDDYLSQAMSNNPALAQASFEVEAERQRLENLRARFYPSLALQARASVAEGGRTIDFPAGDLLNPVYATLNAQAVAAGQPPRFPKVENQSIPLLRPTEQDTRLIVRGPISNLFWTSNCKHKPKQWVPKRPHSCK